MANLQFADFVWPNEPERYKMHFSRDYEVTPAGGGLWTATQGSRLARKIECEGVFYGSNAYASFSTLATLFIQSASGLLCHPKWNSLKAFIGELEALEEPGEDFIHYRILFVELPA